MPSENLEYDTDSLYLQDAKRSGNEYHAWLAFYSRPRDSNICFLAS